MSSIIEPTPEFRGLSETEIEKALADPDPANPVAVEVARLIQGYTANFQAHVEKLGRIPEAILRARPRWPIEAVAMRLTTETLRHALK
jgi:hypothetical protein